jgi:uncharacterized protein
MTLIDNRNCLFLLIVLISVCVESLAQQPSLRMATEITFPRPDRTAIAALRPLPNESTAVHAGETERALFSAAETADFTAVKKLLAADINVNARSVSDDTVLAAAVRGGDIEIVRMLLRRGARPDVSGRDGYTPLGLAALRGYLESARALLAAGADVNLKSANGNTPLHDAVLTNRLELVNLLLAHRADLTRRNDAGLPALAMAAMGGHTDIIAALLYRGANPNITDRQGHTPLHWALEKNQRAAGELLLAGGARVPKAAMAGVK